MSNLVKTIILLVVLAVLFIGGRSLVRNDQPAAGSLASEQFLANASPENREFLEILRSITDVRLDGTLFTTPMFNSLVDFTVPLVDRPRGLVNPFLPIGLTKPLPSDPDPAESVGTNTVKQTPRSTYLAMRIALEQTQSFDEAETILLQYATGSTLQAIEAERVGGTLPDTFKEQMFALVKTNIPVLSNIDTDGITENVNGDQAILSVSTKDGSQSGTVTLLNENGFWKIDAESWSSN